MLLDVQATWVGSLYSKRINKLSVGIVFPSSPVAFESRQQIETTQLQSRKNHDAVDAMKMIFFKFEAVD